MAHAVGEVECIRGLSLRVVSGVGARRPLFHTIHPIH